MRVLIIEDEARMAALLRQGLEEESYAVDVVTNGEEALHWLQSAPYDLVILDVMLPGKDGFQICREYRATGGRAPVLMLTARDAMQDRVWGLDIGADDYLIKPFGMPELLARLRALTRREGPSKTPLLSIYDLVLDTAAKRATRAGKSIDLTATEYALLEYMMRHVRQVLSREQITDHIWNADFDAGSKLIEVYIHNLRRKIDESHTVKLIHTVRGLGYRLGDDETA